MRVEFHGKVANGDTLEQRLAIVGRTPDGLSVLVSNSRREIPDGKPQIAQETELWSLPLNGGQPRRISGTFSVPNAYNLRLSPDGTHFLVELTRTESRSVEVSVVENVLPRATTK